MATLIQRKPYWKLDSKTGKFIKVIPPPTTLEGVRCPIRNKKKQFRRQGKRFTRKAHKALKGE